jgi:hypothetical protein
MREERRSRERTGEREARGNKKKEKIKGKGNKINKGKRNE